METQTRFDLNTAVVNWRQELEGQPDLTPEVCRELEMHLRDTVAELHKRGLNDEESFWLASRRLGRPERLNEEFAKADSTKIWRERAFWMLLAILAVSLWNCSISYIFLRLNLGGARIAFNLVLAFSRWLPVLSGIIGVALIAKGRLELFVKMERVFLHSRVRIAAAAIPWAVLNAVLLTGLTWNCLEFIVWPIVLVGLLLWLTPKQTSLKVKPA